MGGGGGGDYTGKVYAMLLLTTHILYNSNHESEGEMTPASTDTMDRENIYTDTAVATRNILAAKTEHR